MFTSFNARALGLALTAHETLRLASDHGFGGVDVMVRDALDAGEDLAALRREMDARGLRGGAFPMPFDWRGDEPSFRAGLGALPRHAEAAARLGIARTGTWVLPEASDRAADRAALDDFHRRRLGPIAEALAPFGITLGLEVIGVQRSRTGAGPRYLTRLDELEPLRADLEGALGVPIGVVADAWHLYAAAEPIANVPVPRVVWAHVADLPAGAPPDRSGMIDSERGLPGEHGAVENRALLAALRARGYDGPVTAEPLGRCRTLVGLDPDAAAKATAEALRSVWPT